MNYDETQQKLILRKMNPNLLALVAVDTATDDFEVIYTNGAYREYENRYQGKEFFDKWIQRGSPSCTKTTKSACRTR